MTDTTLAILQKYAGEGAPRYTSYPPATRFSDTVTGNTLRGWLGDVAPGEVISLYVHVPFCAQQCWYCGCNQKLARHYGPVAGYVETLLLEIDRTLGLLPDGVRFGHLHFGGGTPTVLTPDDMIRVMDALTRRVPAARGAEIAIEIDPRTLAPEMIPVLGKLGFTRVSLGVQEFDPAVQAAINRIQPLAMIEETVAALRGAGVADINFDLMYGLPHQRADSLRQTVLASAAMGPSRIALFGYAHVPWFAKSQRMIQDEALPSPHARAEQALVARRALVDAGYVAIGIDHFALPDDDLAKAFADGSMRRNFQGYTTDTSDTLIGLGASSISRTRHGYAQNHAAAHVWDKAVKTGEVPVARGLVFAGDDTRRGRIIEDLLCQGRASQEDLTDAGALLAPLEADGLLQRRDGAIELTETGTMLARLVARSFDAYQAGASQQQATVL
ncbi:MAG: oxygen-independent coproporphyrinogen III oxidase [Hyphomonadaceae bacterium]|jgi:oxygen-independent coproporphyrinogen-3 oxidase|nr:oxygen-independent coproporphyrinogen III oxidase [Hyphomonadaceae bacterium]